MFKYLLSILVLTTSFLITGCVSLPSVPMDSRENDIRLKSFPTPNHGNAGVYIFRHDSWGQALTKDIYIDGKKIGTTANKVYFYKELPAGSHTFATESEFSPNELVINLEGGLNYFIEQYIKMGLLVGGANLKQVSQEKGKEMVLRSGLAKEIP